MNGSFGKSSRTLLVYTERERERERGKKGKGKKKKKDEISYVNELGRGQRSEDEESPCWPTCGAQRSAWPAKVFAAHQKKKKQTRGEHNEMTRGFNILIFWFEVFLLGHDASSMMQENHFSLLLLLLGVSIRTGDLVCRPAISHHWKKEKEKLLEHLSILKNKKRKSEYIIQGRRREKPIGAAQQF